jgi:hypothetical protein
MLNPTNTHFKTSLIEFFLLKVDDSIKLEIELYSI